jgi:hypothetical protein
LTERSRKTLTGEINVDQVRRAILIEAASRPTEKLIPLFAEPMRAAVDAESDLNRPAEPGTTAFHSGNLSAWSFDPPDNCLKNVVLRIQQFAGDMLVAQGVRWELATPSELDQINLSAEQCLHLFLIFKEAIQNIARHAGCSTVSAEVSVRKQLLEVKIHDNGCGLIGKLLGKSTIHRRSGGGLNKIRRRVAEMGGALEIASALGWGTRLTLTFPLNGSEVGR